MNQFSMLSVSMLKCHQKECKVFRTNSYAQAPSLKNLAKEHLGQPIHRGNGRHDPVKDAKVCIDLMKSKIRESQTIYSFLNEVVSPDKKGTGSSSSSSSSRLSTGWKIGLGLFAGVLAVGTAAMAVNEEETQRERERRRL